MVRSDNSLFLGEPVPTVRSLGIIDTDGNTTHLLTWIKSKRMNLTSSVCTHLTDSINSDQPTLNYETFREI